MPKAVIVDMNAKQRTFSFHCISILVLKSTKCQNNDVAKRLKRQKLQNMDKKYVSIYKIRNNSLKKPLKLLTNPMMGSSFVESSRKSEVF